MKRLKPYITILFFLGFIVIGCHKDSAKNVAIIDHELQAYIDLFATEAASRSVPIAWDELPLSVQFTDIEDAQIQGQCNQYNNGKLEILIDRETWNKMDDSNKEILLFHELGHCVLGRSHKDISIRGRCESIMRSNLGSCRLPYSTNRSLYLDELFTF